MMRRQKRSIALYFFISAGSWRAMSSLQKIGSKYIHWLKRSAQHCRGNTE